MGSQQGRGDGEIKIEIGEDGCRRWQSWVLDELGLLWRERLKVEGDGCWPKGPSP